MTGLLGDLRSSLRALGRRPVFTAGAVAALALGIGANLGLFTMVHAVVLRELPYRDADRLLWIWSTRTDRDRAFFSLPDYRELRAATETLDAVIPVAMWSVTLTGGDRPARLTGARIGAEGFDVLGARAAAGRLFSAADGTPGEGRVVVLGHRLWQVKLRDEIAGTWRKTLPLLYGASALVLLAACANLANLLLARAIDRKGELAVRVALGALRGRLATERVIEAASSLWRVECRRCWWRAGVWISYGDGPFGPSALPRASEIAIDWRVILYGLALSLATGLWLAGR